MIHHEICTDFVVVGGGLAGVCAALAAARNGARVVLVQDRSVLGGNASSEVKMHIVGADCHGHRPGARESGLIEELKLEDAVRNPHRSYSQWDLLLYEKVVTEPGITLLLDTDCVGCEVDEANGHRRITMVRAVRNSTEDTFIIRAPFFADCSGDGRLGLEAGADYTVGREARSDYDEPLALDRADRHTLGSSILFTARRYDAPQSFFAPGWIRKFRKDDFKHRPIPSYEYGYWWFEWGGHLDTLKDNEIIRHELLRIALGIWDYVKNSGEHPDSANWALEWIGSVPGKRETRRFLGPHVLTQQDIEAGRIFDDQVAYGGWWLDLHPPHGVDASDQAPCEQIHFPHLYSVPLRCLYSRNVDNLFFAGRNISATHVAFASTRVMGTCSVVGQAVGTAAALAVACFKQTPASNGNGAKSAPRPDVARARPRRGAAAPATIAEISSGSRPPLRVRADAHAPFPAAVALLTPPAGGIAAAFENGEIVRLQQRLLKDDAFLPALRGADDSDLARAAVITASDETGSGPAGSITDGITRELFTHLGPWADGLAHRWESARLPAWIELTWPTPQRVTEIHFTFDSGLQRELILSASDWTTRKTIRGPQPELVRDYDVLLDDRVVLSIRGNHLRKRVHRFGKTLAGRRLRVLVVATHGVPSARIFEVRAYGS